MKRALITGITGQDGSYLAEFLLDKDYEVHGIIRRSSSFNTGRIDHIYQDPHERKRRLILHYGDLTDASNVSRLIEKIKPDEIYNLGAQSHVMVSFEMPEYTGNADALGTLRLLDAIKNMQGVNPVRSRPPEAAAGSSSSQTSNGVKFYQAGSSEMFGTAPAPQSESTPFHPRSPYACAKAYAHHICVNYREAYGMHVCNGILFNHESPRRGGTFVSKKVMNWFAKKKLGHTAPDKLYLGRLDPKRDWGYAKEYVEAMWLMLQQPQPYDYVIGTGESHSVREMVEETARVSGFEIEWKGKGLEEKGIDRKSGETLVAIDPRYIRPAEVENLQADMRKAKKQLQWEPKVKFKELIRIMMEAELKELGANPHDHANP